ncbi:MAG: hypothetical protein ACYC6D_09780 [Melioribacteraceae bacterium]
MEQVKISLRKEHTDFIKHHSKFGFKDRSSLVRKAIDYLKEKLDEESLKSSAEIINHYYKNDSESNMWIEDSVKDWPE